MITLLVFCTLIKNIYKQHQYNFIYEALLENNLYGDTEVEASEVSIHIDELMQKMPGNITALEHEYKVCNK